MVSATQPGSIQTVLTGEAGAIETLLRRWLRATHVDHLLSGTKLIVIGPEPCIMFYDIGAPGKYGDRSRLANRWRARVLLPDTVTYYNIGEAVQVIWEGVRVLYGGFGHSE